MYSRKNLVFNLIQNIFVGITITISVILLTTGFTTIAAFVVSFLKAYAINYIACLVLPIPIIMEKVCEWSRLEAKSIWARVIQTLLSDIGYVTVITIVMFIWELGPTPMAFQVWKMTYGRLLVVGFCVGFFMGPVSMSLTSKLLHE